MNFIKHPFRLHLIQFRFILIVILSLLLIGCSSSRKTNFKQQLAKSTCATVDYSYDSNELPLPFHQLKIDSVLEKSFSHQALNVAHAYGLLDDITQYIQVSSLNKSNQTLENKVELLALSQRINNTIQIASVEISAVASEIDCEEERIEQVANYLVNSEDELDTKLTVGAIVVGAAGAVIQGILISSHDETNAGDVIGISMGLAEASLGMLLLFNHQKIEFYHPRNAVREIWEGPPTSKIFPPSIWYYLNYKNNLQNPVSLREQLTKKWIDFGQIETSKRKTESYNLNFGNGGKYTAEALKNRANMYDQIESQIKLIKQDITILAQEFQRLELSTR